MNTTMSRIHAGLLSIACLLFIIFHTLSMPMLDNNSQVEKVHMRDAIEIEISGYLQQKSDIWLDAFIKQKKRASENRPPALKTTQSVSEDSGTI